MALEYTGTWRWDMALYLSTAKIDAYYQGQRLANVSFAAPNSLNTNKWGSAESRIALMLDVLFGKTTAPEATKRL